MRATGRFLPDIGAQRGHHGSVELTQDTVFVQTGDNAEIGFNLLGPVRLTFLAGRHKRRVKAGLEQLDNGLGNGRVFVQGGFDVVLAEAKTELLEVACVSTQHADGARVQRAAQHQLVEVIALDLAPPGLAEQGLKARLDAGQISAGGQLQAEVVNPQRRLAGTDMVGVLIEHARTHAFEHRQRIRQRHLGRVVDLEAQQAGTGIDWPIQLDRQWRGRRQGCQQIDVFGAFSGRKILAISGREVVGKAVRQQQTRAFAMGAQ